MALGFTFSNFNTERDFVLFDSSKLPENKDDRYIDCAGLFEEYGSKKIQVVAFYRNKKTIYADYAPMCAIVLPDSGNQMYVNLPMFQLREVEAILASETAIKQINAGKCGLTVEPYEKGEDTFFKAVWCDYSAKK